MSKPKSCVIVVENLPVPFDRRVWQEAQALVAAGWSVSVICPQTKAFPVAHEVIDSIAIYRHPLPLEARGKWAFAIEYGAALFHELRLLTKVWRERGFGVIQACNPPDIIFLAALPFKLMGVKFIFDQHDISPELYKVKFGRTDLFYRLLLTAERATYALADAVITANQSFCDIATSRGGKAPKDVHAVYSIPSRKRIYRGEADQSLREGVKIVLGYIGIIGDQDGVDHLVRAAKALVDRGVRDFRVVVVGDGPALPAVKDLARELGLDSEILFAGYRSGTDLIAHISAFDIGVIPDPVNECNDLMSMNKVFEYSALGIPTVAYRLRETMRLLGDTGVYAPTDDPEGLAEACLTLMQDDRLRLENGARAGRLSAENFIWENEAAKYVAVFEGVLNPGKAIAAGGSKLEQAKSETAT